MCDDFMNSQEAGIAYLKWGQALPALVYQSLVWDERLSALSEKKKVVTRWHLRGRSEMYGEGVTDGYRLGWSGGEGTLSSATKRTYVCSHNFRLIRLFGLQYTPIMPWVNKEDNANEWHVWKHTGNVTTLKNTAGCLASLHASSGTKWTMQWLDDAYCPSSYYLWLRFLLLLLCQPMHFLSILEKGRVFSWLKW